jgi:hypothetical protein
LTHFLNLRPREIFAQLQITLSIEKVQQCQPYEALSYVRGKEVSENSMIRDGQPAKSKLIWKQRCEVCDILEKKGGFGWMRFALIRTTSARATVKWRL